MDDAPEYVRQVLAESQQVQLQEVVRRPLSRNPFDPALVSVVKDESERLRAFLGHYRTLGIRQFAFIDNGSRDDTVERLAGEPDTTVFATDRSFDWVRKQGWITRLSEELGRNRWYLCVDADEHLVFDGAGDRSFSDLTRWMEAAGIHRVRGMLVDMYANGPLLHPPGDGQTSPLQRWNLFDTDAYRRKDVPRMRSVKGGPRHRALAAPGFDIDPELTKYPLFRLRPGEVFANPHHIWPYEDNFTSPCYLGLLHFKFLPGLMARIRTAIEEKNYWNDSVEYRSYQAVLKDNPELSLQYEGSRRYTGPEDLVDAGLIEAIDWNAHRLRRLWLGARRLLSGA